MQGQTPKKEQTKNLRTNGPFPTLRPYVVYVVYVVWSVWRLSFTVCSFSARCDILMTVFLGMLGILGILVTCDFAVALVRRSPQPLGMLSLVKV